jgi:hypothetical protein
MNPCQTCCGSYFIPSLSVFDDDDFVTRLTQAQQQMSEGALPKGALSGVSSRSIAIAMVPTAARMDTGAASSSSVGTPASSADVRLVAAQVTPSAPWPAELPTIAHAYASDIVNEGPGSAAASTSPEGS